MVPLPVGGIAVLAPPGAGVPPAGLRPLPATQALEHLAAAVRSELSLEVAARLASLAASVPAAALGRGPVDEMSRSAAALLG